MKVVFKKRVHGSWKAWDVRETNARGIATLVKKHLQTGKRLEIKAIVRGNSEVNGTKAGPDRVRVS